MSLELYVMENICERSRQASWVLRDVEKIRTQSTIRIVEFKVTHGNNDRRIPVGSAVFNDSNSSSNKQYSYKGISHKAGGVTEGSNQGIWHKQRQEGWWAAKCRVTDSYNSLKSKFNEQWSRHSRSVLSYLCTCLSPTLSFISTAYMLLL